MKYFKAIGVFISLVLVMSVIGARLCCATSSDLLHTDTLGALLRVEGIGHEDIAPYVFNGPSEREMGMARENGFVFSDAARGRIAYNEQYTRPTLSYALSMIAHGSSKNLEEREGSDDHSVLTQKGITETIAGAEKWCDIYGDDFMRTPHDYVFVRSSAQETKETYEIYRRVIKERLGIDIKLIKPRHDMVEPRLRGMNMGVWAHRSLEELKKFPQIGPVESAAKALFLASNVCVKPLYVSTTVPHEDLLDVIVRTRQWMQDRNKEYQGKKVFAFSHGVSKIATDIIMHTERVAYHDGYIGWGTYNKKRGEATYIGGTPSLYDKSSHDQVPCLTVTEVDVHGVIGHLGVASSQGYQRVIAALVVNARRVHDAYEYAQTDEDRSRVAEKTRVLLQSINELYDGIPRFEGEKELFSSEGRLNVTRTVAFLRKLRTQYKKVYADIVQANKDNDREMLVRLNAEATRLNYMLMRIQLRYARYMIEEKNNWMAAILLLEGAQYKARALKYEAFFRKYREREEDDSTFYYPFMSDVVRRIDVATLEVRLPTEHQQRNRVAYKMRRIKVANRLQDIKRSIKRGYIHSEELKKKYVSLLNQLYNHYKQVVSSKMHARAARLCNYIRQSIELLPLESETNDDIQRVKNRQRATEDEIKELTSLVGTDYVRVRTRVSFNSITDELKSELHTIENLEAERDLIHWIRPSLQFFVDRMYEPDMLGVNEWSLVRSELDAIEKWINHSTLETKKEILQYITYAASLIADGVVGRNVSEKIRGYLEGATQSPGVLYLMDIRLAECMQQIRSAEKRASDVYTKMCDAEIIEAIRTMETFVNNEQWEECLDRIRDMEEYYCSGHLASVYAYVRSDMHALAELCGNAAFEKNAQLRLAVRLKELMAKVRARNVFVALSIYDLQSGKKETLFIKKRKVSVYDIVATFKQEAFMRGLQNEYSVMVNGKPFALSDKRCHDKIGRHLQIEIAHSANVEQVEKEQKYSPLLMSA